MKPLELLLNFNPHLCLNAILEIEPAIASSISWITRQLDNSTDRDRKTDGSRASDELL